MIGLQFVDLVWTTKSIFWPRPSSEHWYSSHEVPLEAVPVDYIVGITTHYPHNTQLF